MSSSADVKAAVQKQFGNAAENYRLSAAHSHGEDLDRMMEAAALTGSERVLDAGCGAGHTAIRFAPYVAEVVALDLTAEMLQQVDFQAHERGLSNIVTHPGDVEEIPFPDAAFDRVTSRFSAHHYPNPGRAVIEFARVLKPAGSLLLSDVIAPVSPAHDTFLQAIELLRDPSHVRDHRIDEWQRYLEAAGFTTRVEMTWELGLDFDPWVQRIGTPQPNIDMIRRLFDGAPQDIRAAMKVDDTYRFYIPCALMIAHKTA